MKEIKENKGITLVALIITIIVLLILAAVTISAVQGDGIIAHAKNARDNYQTAQNIENTTLGDYMTKLNDANGESGNNDGNNGGASTIWTDNNDGTFTKESITVAIGDTVNYTPDTGSYTSESKYSGYTNDKSFSTENLTWKVMGINSNGQLELISAVQTSNYFYLEGALGYNNGVNLLNNACKAMYSKENIGTARSLNLEDIEKHYTEAGKSVRDSYGGYNTEITYTSNNYYPTIYAQEKAGTLGRSQNLEALTQDTLTQSGDLIVRVTSYGLNTSNGNYIDNDNFKTMIFGTNSNFWIASRCVSKNGNYCADFNLQVVVGNSIGCSNLFSSYGLTSYQEYFLRPVVTLETNVNLETAGTNAWNIK